MKGGDKHFFPFLPSPVTRCLARREGVGHKRLANNRARASPRQWMEPSDNDSVLQAFEAQLDACVVDAEVAACYVQALPKEQLRFIQWCVEQRRRLSRSRSSLLAMSSSSSQAATTAQVVAGEGGVESLSPTQAIGGEAKQRGGALDEDGALLLSSRIAVSNVPILPSSGAEDDDDENEERAKRVATTLAERSPSPSARGAIVTANAPSTTETASIWHAVPCDRWSQLIGRGPRGARVALPLLTALIEAVGHFAHWLMIDDPFEDDDDDSLGVRGRGGGGCSASATTTDLASCSGGSVTLRQHCAAAGSFASFLVPGHSVRPFSRELLDSHLAFIVDEFPTTENDVIDIVASLPGGVSLDDITAATTLMSEPVILGLRRWAYALGRYYCLLSNYVQVVAAKERSGRIIRGVNASTSMKYGVTETSVMTSCATSPMKGNDPAPHSATTRGTTTTFDSEAQSPSSSSSCGTISRRPPARSTGVRFQSASGADDEPLVTQQSSSSSIPVALLKSTTRRRPQSAPTVRHQPIQDESRKTQPDDDRRGVSAEGHLDARHLATPVRSSIDVEEVGRNAAQLATSSSSPSNEEQAQSHLTPPERFDWRAAFNDASQDATKLRLENHQLKKEIEWLRQQLLLATRSSNNSSSGGVATGRADDGGDATVGGTDSLDAPQPPIGPPSDFCSLRSSGSVKATRIDSYRRTFSSNAGGSIDPPPAALTGEICRGTQTKLACDAGSEGSSFTNTSGVTNATPLQHRDEVPAGSTATASPFQARQATSTPKSAVGVDVKSSSSTSSPLLPESFRTAKDDKKPLAAGTGDGTERYPLSTTTVTKTPLAVVVAGVVLDEPAPSWSNGWTSRKPVAEAKREYLEKRLAPRSLPSSPPRAEGPTPSNAAVKLLWGDQSSPMDEGHRGRDADETLPDRPASRTMSPLQRPPSASFGFGLGRSSHLPTVRDLIGSSSSGDGGASLSVGEAVTPTAAPRDRGGGDGGTPFRSSSYATRMGRMGLSGSSSSAAVAVGINQQVMVPLSAGDGATPSIINVARRESIELAPLLPATSCVSTSTDLTVEGGGGWRVRRAASLRNKNSDKPFQVMNDSADGASPVPPPPPAEIAAEDDTTLTTRRRATPAVSSNEYPPHDDETTSSAAAAVQRQFEAKFQREIIQRLLGAAPGDVSLVDLTTLWEEDDPQRANRSTAMTKSREGSPTVFPILTDAMLTALVDGCGRQDRIVVVKLGPTARFSLSDGAVRTEVLHRLVPRLPRLKHVDFGPPLATLASTATTERQATDGKGVAQTTVDDIVVALQRKLAQAAVDDVLMALSKSSASAGIIEAREKALTDKDVWQIVEALRKRPPRASSSSSTATIETTVPGMVNDGSRRSSLSASSFGADVAATMPRAPSHSFSHPPATTVTVVAMSAGPRRSPLALAGESRGNDLNIALSQSSTATLVAPAVIGATKVLDLRNNLITDDAAAFLVDVIRDPRTGLVNVLLQGNHGVSPAMMRQLREASGRKRAMLARRGELFGGVAGGTEQENQ